MEKDDEMRSRSVVDSSTEVVVDEYIVGGLVLDARLFDRVVVVDSEVWTGLASELDDTASCSLK